MIVGTRNKVIGFRRNANDNNRETPELRKENNKTDIWLLTEEQARKGISYYIKTNRDRAAEFAYETSMVFDTKSKMGIDGSSESSRRLMVLAKILFRHYGHIDKAIWAEQKLLGLDNIQIEKEARLREAGYLLRTSRSGIHSREEMKEMLRKFRIELR